MTSSSPEPMTWQEELASIISDTGIRYSAAGVDESDHHPPAPLYNFEVEEDESNDNQSEKSLKEEAKEFMKATGEMLIELGKGVKDIAKQSMVGAEEFYYFRIGKKKVKEMGKKLEFLNNYVLPEDKDPVYSWIVVISVAFLAISVVEMAEQNVQRRDRRSPRIWSSHAMSEFFRIAADAYQAAGKFKKGIHKKILIELNEALVNVPGESPFTVEQVTAKYDSLKKKWVVWRNLRNKTGAGWDNARGTISGSELWWIDRQAEFGNSILKYKRQPIQNLNELEQIFSNSVATGEAAFTPGTTVNPQHEPHSPAAEDVTQSYFDQEWGVPLEDINTQMPFRQPTQTPGSGSSSKVRSSRRRRTENEEKMNEIVDMMYEKHKNKKNRSETDSPSSNPSTNASNSPYDNTSSQPTTPISDLRTTIERVKQFEDIDLSKAISLLQIKENRDTLTFLEDDDARNWLRYEIEKTNLAMRYQNYLLTMPPQYPMYPPQFPPTFPPPYPPQFPPNFPPQYPPQ